MSQKVVINVCFGGFGLSEAAIHAYVARKGLTLYPEQDSELYTIYWIVPPEQRIPNLPDWHNQPLEARQNWSEQYDAQRLYNKKIERTDPDLIAVIEELGTNANGACSELKIIEIPDNIHWKIEEYDGLEHIAEVHRTWWG